MKSEYPDKAENEKPEESAKKKPARIDWKRLRDESVKWNKEIDHQIAKNQTMNPRGTLDYATLTTIMEEVARKAVPTTDRKRKE